MTVALGSLAWSELDAAGTTLLVPLGSCEQHGPHLPLDTDTRIAVHVASAAADRLTRRHSRRTLVAPAIAIGASGEHDAFAGTLSIGTEVLASVVVELVRSADRFGSTVLVNAHGGNATALAAACSTLDGDGRPTRCWHAAVPGGDAHAGRSETSMLLAIDAGVVRLERAAPGNVIAIAELLDELRTRGVGAVSANGVLGDPTGATASEGQQLLDGLVDRLVDTVLGDRGVGSRPRPTADRR